MGLLRLPHTSNVYRLCTENKNLKISYLDIFQGQIVELKNQKEELVSYAKDAIKKIQKEVMEEERKVNECKDCFSIASEKEEIEIEISKLHLELSTIMKDVDEYGKKKIRFEEQREFANRLELRDGKCPVCDSFILSFSISCSICKWCNYP